MKKLAIGLVVLALSSSGCTMFEYLAPHQLWKLNRQPAQSREDAFFSIPAKPVPASSGPVATTRSF